MPDRTVADIRNIAVVGHSGSGKTTLIEGLLARAGAIGQAGTVERGSTVTDHDPLEKKHQHSLDSALAWLETDGTHLHLIDTPGSPDFRGNTLTAMAATEMAAIVINAQNGVEFSTRRLMRRAKMRRLCRMIIINKMDAAGIDLVQLVRDIREEFGPECLPINLPAGNFSTVHDCFFNETGDTDILSLAAAHTEITDQVVEVDEELMEGYLEQGQLDREQLHEAFEKALRRGHLVPICFVSAKTGAGLGEFLKFSRRLLPNPAEGNPAPFMKGSGDSAIEVKSTPDPDAHVLAHVFKITNDPFVGKLAIFRIYQGTIRPDTELFIGDGRKPFKVNHLFRLQGSKTEEIHQGLPGDICAVAKVDELKYDDVLHDSHDEDDWHLEPLDLPQPMFGLAIEATARGQEQKLATALARLAEEDPCLILEHHQELNETVIRGLGELHLRITLERMQTRFGVDVETRPPRIAFRETITRSAEGHYRHKKQTGGAGQFGEVFLRISPQQRGSGFTFKNSVAGGSIPANLIPAVEKGVRQLLDEGAIAGFPIQDVVVDVYDGKHHPVDSKEAAFMTAGKRAFLDAVVNAGAQILEPVVNIDVTVPEAYIGDVTSTLATTRARISGTQNHSAGLVTVNGQAPLSELADFQTRLKSSTGGEGSYVMEFSHYDPVPHSLQQELVAQFSREEED